MEIERTDPAFPLQLTVTRGGNPVTGLSPVAAVRDASSVGLYLDFADSTFKSSGWAQKTTPLSEVGGGVYAGQLDAASIADLDVVRSLSVEYAAAGAVAVDLLLVTTKLADTSLTRKYQTNRLEAAGGAPGTARLYDDDGATVIKTHQLLDEFGNAVLPARGTPARRSQGV